MVNELTGKINGLNIVFTREEGDIWKTDIPRLPSGEHILELYATDTAGNKAYFATALIYVDKDNIIQRIIFIDYVGKPYKRQESGEVFGLYEYETYVKNVNEEGETDDCTE